MSPDARLVQVEIFGQTYRLRADEDPEYVTTLASFVDGRMREVARQSTAVDTLKVAVLTALNIADEHMRLKRESGTSQAGGRQPVRERNGGQGELASRISEWSQILDEALEG